MKLKLTLIFVIVLSLTVFGQEQGQAQPDQQEVQNQGGAEANQAAPAEALPETQFAAENNPGHVQRLIDFNLLGQGSRFEEPFHIENWILELDGAVNYTYNRSLTYVKVATDNSGKRSIGFRVHFPRVKINTYAELRPVFGVPFLRTKYRDKGFVDNVGVIRSLKVKVRSNVFPYRITVLLQDKQGKITEHRLNESLNFYGWRELKWENTRYEIHDSTKL